jgi:nitrogen fixation/metabolism regulation signal transduction histidine kinase
MKNLFSSIKFPFSKDTYQAAFLGLLFMYIALIGMVLILSSHLIPDISQGKTSQRGILLILAALFLLFLLGTVTLNVIRLFRDRYSRKPGVRFKVRLVGFFILISSLSSIPQGLLALSFINSMVDTLFNTSVQKALEGGVAIAITYYEEKIERIRGVSKNPLALSILEKPDRASPQTWSMLQALYPDISCYQVFSTEGNPLYEAGMYAGFIDAPSAVRAPEGLLPRETRSPGLTVLRIKKTIEKDPLKSFVVLSFILPQSFDTNAELITSTLNTVSQLNQHRYLFNTAVTLIYIFFALPLLFLSILVSLLLSDEIIRPVENIEEATRRVAEGDFSYRVLTGSRNDLSHLAESFNRMVAEIEKNRRQLQHSEKVIAWQEIAQQLAHEIKNPLTPIKLSAERLLKKYQEDEDKETFERVLKSSVDTILKETHALDRLLKEFKDFSHIPPPFLQTVSLKKIIEEAAEGYRFLPQIRILTDSVSDQFTIFADPDQIRQVFTNLITNAIDAMPSGGEITFRADLVKKGNTRYCRIQISDTGQGIPEEYKNLVFNPYFTTKGQGTGLGLSIVERILFDHKGQIWFESEAGIGTVFFIDLPMEPME